MTDMQELRIQKYLSEQGIASRRRAEELVARGLVLVNGKPASIGQKIVPEIDEIMVEGVIVEQRQKNKKIYIMLYKPAGVVTTMSDEQSRPCISDILKKEEIGERVYPVGRLDMYSEGLLLLTNDGETANKLMHPRHKINKIYHILIKGKIDQDTVKKLSEPIFVEGKKTAPAKVEIIEQKENHTKLKVEISEGKNRQLRRLCENLDLTILKLKRICVGRLNLGNLAPGKWRHLSRGEIEYLKEC
ncbi:MAG: rRNA pseudouridine synthase [Oscillospiraceae bacterium]|nr:rRNA pseudouridine synthase [Oscillospiraceae bacterium]